MSNLELINYLLHFLILNLYQILPKLQTCFSFHHHLRVLLMENNCTKIFLINSSLQTLRSKSECEKFIDISVFCSDLTESLNSVKIC